MTLLDILRGASSNATFIQFLIVVCLLTISGALGGLAYHMLSPRRSFTRRPGREPDQGSEKQLNVFSDLLIGAICGNIVHLVTPSFYDYSSPFALNAWLGLLSLGILAGFGSRTLLSRLSSRLSHLAVLRDKVETHEDMFRSNEARVASNEARVEAALSRQAAILYHLNRNIMRDLLSLKVYPTEDRVRIVESLAAVVEARHEEQWTVEDFFVLATRAMNGPAPDFRSALDLLERASEKDREKAYPWAIRTMSGLCRYGLNDLEEALKAFLLARDTPFLTPEQINATLVNLAFVHVEMGNPQSALDCVQGIVPKAGDSADSMSCLVEKARIIRAVAQKELKHPKSAISCLNEMQQPRYLGRILEPLKNKTVYAGFIGEMRQKNAVKAPIREALMKIELPED